MFHSYVSHYQRVNPIKSHIKSQLTNMFERGWNHQPDCSISLFDHEVSKMRPLATTWDNSRLHISGPSIYIYVQQLSETASYHPVAWKLGMLQNPMVSHSLSAYMYMIMFLTNAILKHPQLFNTPKFQLKQIRSPVKPPFHGLQHHFPS